MDEVTYNRLVQRGYDVLADAYTDRRPVSDLEGQLLDEFCTRLPDDGIVLDAGCGGATPATETLIDELNVVGVDISRAQIDLATDRFPAGTFLRGDMQRLPFQQSSVDGICALYSLIHVINHQATLSEFARVLKRGGRLLLTTGVSGEIGIDSNWFDSGEQMLLNVPGREKTLDLLASTGFEDISEHTHSADPDPHDPLYLTARV